MPRPIAGLVTGRKDARIMDLYLSQRIGHLRECLDDRWAKFAAAQPTDWQTDLAIAEQRLDNHYSYLKRIQHACAKLNAFADACDRIPGIEGAGKPAPEGEGD